MFQKIQAGIAKLPEALLGAHTPTALKIAGALAFAGLGSSCQSTYPQQGPYQGGGYGYGAPGAGPVVTRSNSNYGSYGYSAQRTVDYGDRVVSTSTRVSRSGYGASTTTRDPITGASTRIDFGISSNGTPRFNIRTTAPRPVYDVNPHAIYRQEQMRAINQERARQAAQIRAAARAYYGNY